MANDDTGAAVASAAPEGGSEVVESGNLSFDQLAGSILAAGAEGAPTETEGVSAEGEADPSEQAVEDAAETEPDSSPEEELSETQEETSDEDDDDEVLSQLSPNAAKKARKRIDKLTRRAKEAEEAIEARDRKIEEIMQRLEAAEKSSQPATESKVTGSIAEQVRQAASPQDLKRLHDQAKEAKRFAREHWDEQYVELGKDDKGEPIVIDHKELAQILSEAEDVLEQEIPARAKFLQQRSVAAQNAAKDFPAWKDKSNPDHARLMALWNDPVGAKMFHSQPNGAYLAGVMLEGLKVIEARQNKSAEPKETAKQPAKPVPKKAPQLPGMETSAPPTNSGNDYEKKFQSKQSLSQDDLTAYFLAKEMAKRKQG